MGGHIPDMEILLSGGSTKPVGELKVGDKLDTLHQHTFEREEAEVSYVRVFDSPLVSLTLSGKSFTCSEEDLFYSKNNKKWTKATDLSTGDKISQLEGDLEVQGSKKIGRGKSVELTVDNAHTYICDGVLLHNKGGGSPPPPTIIMPPPPPPPQIVTDVTPKETYGDASDYLRRMHERDQKIEERRWNAGMLPEQQAARFSAGNLRDAELDARLNPGYGPQVQFGSQTTPGSGASTAAVINALAPKPQSGSSSRQARINLQAGQGGLSGVSGGKGPQDRLAAAQNAYAVAKARKEQQDQAGYQYEPFEEPSWADRDWYPVMDEWAGRSDPTEKIDPTPKIIKA